MQTLIDQSLPKDELDVLNEIITNKKEVLNRDFEDKDLDGRGSPTNDAISGLSQVLVTVTINEWNPEI